MLYPYELSTGEIVFVECDTEVIDFLVESKRAEENANRRHRYNCPYHIEAIEYEGLEYADPETPEDFSEEYWNALIDHVTVYSDERVVFTFKNGAEIDETL